MSDLHDADEPVVLPPADAGSGESTGDGPRPSSDGDVADAGRRRFFRQFAGEVFQSAATVVGAAQALQRASAEAASSILDPEATLSGGIKAKPTSPSAPTGFRTPFRETPGVIHLIDQRRLPEALVEVECRSAAEVAVAIREMMIRGAPAIGQAAAIGLALTAGKARTMRPYARRATLRGASNGLGQCPADGRQPALGGGSRDGALHGDRRPVRGR